jgi:hypothetical protein
MTTFAAEPDASFRIFQGNGPGDADPSISLAISEPDNCNWVQEVPCMHITLNNLC